MNESPEKNILEIKQFELVEIKDEHSIKVNTKLPTWYKPISVSPENKDKK